jgi:hypothetical protein
MGEFTASIQGAIDEAVCLIEAAVRVQLGTNSMETMDSRAISPRFRPDSG